MRLSVLTPSAALAAFFALSGCATEGGSTSPRSRSARHATEEAESSSSETVSSPHLSDARSSMEKARQLESDAIDERNEALEHQRKMRTRLEQAATLKRGAESNLGDAKRTRDERRKGVEDLERKRADLASKGVSDAELADTVDPDLALERARLKAAEADVDLYDEEVRAYDLQGKDADLCTRGAEARMATSEARRNVVTDLDARAEALAHLAEAERHALAVNQSRAKLKAASPKPATPPPAETTPPPEIR
jgi:hypothetical protein